MRGLTGFDVVLPCSGCRSGFDALLFVLDADRDLMLCCWVWMLDRSHVVQTRIGRCVVCSGCRDIDVPANTPNCRAHV